MHCAGFLSGFGGACVAMAILTQFRPISIAIAVVIFGRFGPQGTLLAVCCSDSAPV